MPRNRWPAPGAALTALALCVLMPVRVGSEEAAPRPPAVPAGEASAAPQAPQGGPPPRAAAGTATQAVQLNRDRPKRERPIELRLSLADAILMGLENNLSIKVSRLDDHIRQREILIAKATFDPFFNLGATFAKNRDPTVSFLNVGFLSRPGVSVSPSETTSYFTSLTGTSPIGTVYDTRVSAVKRDQPSARAGGLSSLNPVTSTEVSITARQPLLNGAWHSVNTAGVRIAENNAVISREQLEITALDTVLLIEDAYWELVFAIQNLEAKSKALQVSIENLDNVRKKKDVGTLAAIDVTTAESQVALRRVDLEESDLLLENSRDQLLNIINYMKRESLKTLWETRSLIGPFENVQVICTTQPTTEIPDLNRDRALGAAFAKRSEYRQLALNVRSQEIRIDVAKNGLLPNIDLVATWAQLGLEEGFDSSFRQLESGRYYSWQAGVEFSIPLSNRGPRSVYRNARDELRKLKVSKVDLENRIVLEVDQIIRTIQSLERKLRDLDERVRLQQELLRAERLKLDVGKSIAYTVSVIENDLVENQTQATRARSDLQKAKADLLRSTGELLEHHRIELAPQ